MPTEQNGTHITRAELAAHIRRIDDWMTNFDSRMRKVEDAVGANTRWASARVTKLIDSILPLGVVAMIVWVLAHAAT